MGALGGAAIGAGLGTIVNPGIGTAIGAGIGALVGGAGGGARKNAKKYISQQLAGIERGPDDATSAAEQARMGAVSNQVVGAQQQMLNQAAMNQGPVAAGAMRSSAQDLAGAGQDAAVKQTSEANRLKQALLAQKRARVENLMFKGADMARQDTEQAMQFAMTALSTVPGLS